MSKQTMIPIRKCVATHERLEKNQLLRVVKVGDGVMIDIDQTREGRGAYIKKDAKIIEKAKKKNPFARALKMKIDPQIYDDILALVGDVDD